MTEKYGFVYIWRDRKHKRFYIGSHWGTENDGYVCSSTWMNRSYKRRPQDFKRKILKVVHDRQELLDEEFKLVNLIPDSELGKSYYNLNNEKIGHWSADTRKLKTIGEKISATKKGKDYTKTVERLKIFNTGKVHSEERKEKRVTSWRSKPENVEQIRALGRSKRGIKLSKETIEKCRQGALGKNTGPMKKIKCTKCQKMGGISQMKRWHFNNCRNDAKITQN